MTGESAIGLGGTGLVLLKVALGLIVFAVALHLDRPALRRILEQPRMLLAGLLSQWLALPALTVVLILWLQPAPGLAAGMLLVAACPGGSVSNYYCLLARGNVALSISLTSLATLAAPLTLPAIFFAGQYLIGAGGVALPAVDVRDIALDLLLLVGLPLMLAGVFWRWRPALAQRLRTPLRRIAGALLAAVVLAGLLRHPQYDLALISLLLWVALHNALALAAGYGVAAAARLAAPERRTLSLETGLQNAGLGIVVAFSSFGGQTEMVLVAATWGVWHLLSGALLSLYWSRRPPEMEPGCIP